MEKKHTGNNQVNQNKHIHHQPCKHGLFPASSLRIRMPGFFLILAIALIIIGCDSIADQQSEAGAGIATSGLGGAFSMVQTFTIECIDPTVLAYNKVPDSKTIEWGNPRNRSSKTVDIEYYNTLEHFVLRVKSSNAITDVMVDNESIKDFVGTAKANEWLEFTLELDAGDTQSFSLQVAGFGPPVYFNVDYALIGECTGWPIDNFTEVVDVISTTGRVWMDRNLGASRAATSSTDTQAYGDIYQWGRAADGHQHRNSVTTNTLSSSDQPGHGVYIVAPNEPGDWRNPQNNNLWQGVNGTNNPCPSGYRLPTDVEWEAELNSWSSFDDAGAFASPLRLTLAGHRFFANGAVSSVGDGGDYWSSTVSGTDARYLFFFSGGAGVHKSERAYGHSIRCIKH